MRVILPHVVFAVTGLTFAACSSFDADPAPSDRDTTDGGGFVDGGAPDGPGAVEEIATGQPDPRVIALDDRAVYWRTDGTRTSDGGFVAEGSVMKRDRAGGSAPVVLRASIDRGAGLALDETSVHYGVQRCSFGLFETVSKQGGDPRNGTKSCGEGIDLAADAQTVFVFDKAGLDLYSVANTIGGPTAERVAENIDGFRGMALTTDSLFYLAAEGVWRVPRDAQPPAIFAAEAGSVALAADDRTVFWATPTEIHAADRAPGGVPRRLVEGADGVAALSVTTRWVYFATKGGVQRIPREGGAPELVAPPDRGAPRALAADERGVYWIAGSDTILGVSVGP